MTGIMIDGYAKGVVPDNNDHLGWAQLMTQVRFELFF